MEQTNRTILFEEINPEQINLINFLADGRLESLSDDELAKIHGELEVSSFEEALEKFKPVIYLVLDSVRKTAQFTNQGKEAAACGAREVIPIKIDAEYRLLRLFLDMLSGRKKNAVCTPDKIRKAMFPVPEYKEFQIEKNRVIRDIINGRQKKAGHKLQRMFQKYDNSIFLIRTFLFEVSEAFLKKEEQKEETIIVIEEQEETQVRVVKCSEHFYLESQKLDEEQKRLVAGVFQEAIEGVELVNEELWKILLCADCEILPEEELSGLYGAYLDYYVSVINGYWASCSSLMETLLGIYVFFEQYRTGEPVMPPKLVIANLIPEQLVDARNREKLLVYLNSTNRKSFYRDTIWYGIIPKLEWNETGRSKEVRERFLGNTRQERKDKNSVQSVQLLANILADFKIQVFISPNITEKATNRYIAEHGADEWIALQGEVADREHASYLYPCIPNFTLLPSEHAAVKIARQADVSDWGELHLSKEYRKVWLNTIGIEASYAAAGLYAACQCPGYLKERFRGKINAELPGVAYQIWKDDHAKKTLSILRMDVFRYDAGIQEELMRKNTGILFGPGKNGSAVLSERSAGGMYGQRDHVSSIQTTTYIERSIRFLTQDFKSTLIKQHFQNRPGSMLSKWAQNPELLNAVLKDGERIEYDLDEKNNRCTFRIYFQEEKLEHVVKLNQ